jgi:hypothetical protein
MNHKIFYVLRKFSLVSISPLLKIRILELLYICLLRS